MDHRISTVSSIDRPGKIFGTPNICHLVPKIFRYRILSLGGQIEDVFKITKCTLRSKCTVKIAKDILDPRISLAILTVELHIRIVPLQMVKWYAEGISHYRVASERRLK